MNPSWRKFRTFPCFLLLLCAGFLWSCLSAAQQTPPPPAPDSASSPASAARESSTKHRRTLPPFLILGTVFDERDYAFPGVQVRVRRKGEKKFRYAMYTNSRGEFAVRVPDGIEYEVVVTRKKYKEQTQEVATNMADVQKRLTFKLETIAPARPGGSK